MTTRQDGNYYTSNRKTLIRQMDKFLMLVRNDLIEKYGEAGAASIKQETLVGYEMIIPQLPEIGGRSNPLIQNLIQSAQALALYRVLKAHGGTAEETGEMIYRGLVAMVNQYPAFLRNWMGQISFSQFSIRKMQEAARKSQEREYGGDWVFEIVIGDGQQFNYGIDYAECAIVKFMTAQDTKELTPYLCNADYVISKATGTGLRRTKTLAWGCDKCDFRFVKGGTTLDAWPPALVEKHCGKSAK